MKKNNKWVGLIVVILVIIGGIALYKHNKSNKEVPLTNEVGKEIPSAPEKTSYRRSITTGPISTAVAVKPDYSTAVSKYTDRLVQFNDRCQVSPRTQVYKLGTTVMLDNRSNEARSVVISNKTYPLGAYDYTFATLDQKGSFGVDCGDARNVATITVQE